MVRGFPSRISLSSGRSNSDVRNDGDGDGGKHQLVAEVLIAGKIQPVKQEDLLWINGSFEHPFIKLIC
jgi:hypothetical protein